MKEYNVAVVGAGFIGAAHVEALRRLGNVNVVALCDAKAAQEKADVLHIPKAYAGYDEMLRQEPLDAIHICTPNHTHYQIAKAAINAGVHFVCEKPFTTTIEQARELVLLAKEKKVTGAVNFHNRLYPIPNEMHQAIAAGEAGRLFSVHGGYLQDWLLYETDYTWRLEKDQVGKTRAIADIGSHWMDLAEFVTGQKIKRVNALFQTVHPVRKKPAAQTETFSGTGVCRQYEDLPIDTEDEAALLLEFEGGAIGTALISMVYAGKKNTTQLCVAGSKKSLEWNSEALNELSLGYREKANESLTKDASLLHAGAAVLASYPSGHVEGFPDALKQVFRQFYNSLEQPGKYSFATLEDGLHEMILCEAVFESATQGTWVEVSK